MKYGITEVDFMSSEIEIVPAFKARTMGLDQSMVAAYGQDDKICVFASLTALMKIENPTKTAVCLIADKEEKCLSAPLINIFFTLENLFFTTYSPIL